MKVKIGISNRHVHLTEETFKKLFNEEIIKDYDLNIMGEFVAKQTLSIKTDKHVFENVKIIGPYRNYDQVEICRKDSFKLGLNPPVRASGDVLNAEKITLKTDLNELQISGCIIANRHIHISIENLEKYGLKNNETVLVSVPGEKGGFFKTYLKETNFPEIEMHVDTDDAAAMGINSGDIVEVVKWNLK